MRTQSLSILILLIGVTACTDRGPMPRIANTSEGDSSIGESSYRVGVRNLATANLITSSPTAEPGYSAVNGQRVDSATALTAMINTGATACYISSLNFPLVQGQLVLTKMTQTSAIQNGHTVYSMKLTNTLNTDTSSFEVICGRIDNRITSANVRESLSGILDTTPY